jgi:hypothetical protein
MPELPLAALGATRIEAVIVDATLSAAVSHQGDLERAREASQPWWRRSNSRSDRVSTARFVDLRP